MSYPWWHIKATYADGHTLQFNATGMFSRHALENLLASGYDQVVNAMDTAEREHGDLLKLEVLHPSTPGLDEATEKCEVCNGLS